MRARQLEVFCAVMRTGTVTAAARELNISQPALSQILRHTEDELRISLFERAKGRLHPTEAATELYQEAERVFSGLDALRRRVADMRAGRVGLVRLAASAPPSMSFLPEAISAFRARHPEVVLRSMVGPVANLTQMVRDGDAGIAVAMNDAPQPGLDVELLGTVTMVCLLPAGHPLSAQTTLTLNDLAAETLISYRQPTLPGRRLARLAAEAGLSFMPEIEIDASISALPFVQQGLGTAVVDGLMPWSRFTGVEVRPLAPEVRLPVTLLTSKDATLSTPHRALLGCLRTAFASHQES
ncbi:LysR family transcriptional regulator [Rhodovibrio salinarum]|uniref:LysR family transcriptional regulator n=1 Tax=Rhodovibrio salinarum TaxID=1087 RepID=A0A934V259_9PROT|nr:LysR family transcriptional regulator [Rhodovibrio salinarum]MBK1699163.1 LysR family transcriptional regulator [Rhodovibrio salinarum]